MKRVLLLYLSFSIFWLAGHKDAVHHLIHGFDSHQEVSVGTSQKSEIKPEFHDSCWIEDFLQHRSHQIHLALDFVTLVGPNESSYVLFKHDRFVIKNSQKFSKMARGPPAFFHG